MIFLLMLWKFYNSARGGESAMSDVIPAFDSGRMANEYYVNNV
jgi:hypothetical protein